MLTRGEFLAVTSEDIKQLRRMQDGPCRRNLMLEWSERWPQEWRCSTDKAWKLISVALAFQAGPGDGNREAGLGLGFDMFYGKCLHRANFYVIGHVPFEWLSDIVGSLSQIDERRYREFYFSSEAQADFAERFFHEVHGVDAASDRWRKYSWAWLKRIRPLYCKALESGRSCVFSSENC